MDARNLVGTTIDGRYDVARLIGAGGMGAVYEAHHAGTGRRVAIKVISTGDFTKDAQLVGRFHREAKAAGAIDTQHICQVLDTGTDPTSGLPFMVMEYMNGEDVQQLLRRVGPLPGELALRVVAQVCMGLQKAHDAHVVHRDIKPANIFLAKGDAGSVLIKVLDFGIAKVKMETASEAGDAGLTRTGTMLGSPLYMSPEQARGSKAIDHRADIWSLGIVLYEMVCGRTPFHHIDALGELIIAICSEAPRPVQDFAPWVAPEVASIIHKAIRVDPAERYQTAAEMLEAVRALLPSTNVEEDMIIGVTEAEKSAVARRLTMPPPPNAIAPSVSVPPPAPSPSIPAPALTSEGGTTDGVAAPTVRRPEAGGRANVPLLVTGAAIGIVVAGIIAFQVIGQPTPAPETGVAANVPTTPAETAAATATAPSAVTPSVSPAGSEKEERTVRLIIFPEDAAVEVDGKSAKVRNGYIELTGKLGSNFKVKVTSGGQSVDQDIVISELGPQPPKVEVKRKGVPGAPATTGAPGPATAQPKPPSGIEQKFE
ncbi:MAG: serine/threonine protein kinase [Myxococcales bacterium]|nr:serine/threonine protein kinase [Myxococcales bacterium]